MCRIFAGQDPENYAYQTRSIRLGGHSTSLRLEAAFWRILEEIADTQGVSLATFITTIHDEVLEMHGGAQNFTSLLRCACLRYLQDVKGNANAEDGLAVEAARKFRRALEAAE